MSSYSRKVGDISSRGAEAEAAAAEAAAEDADEAAEYFIFLIKHTVDTPAGSITASIL
eukprot:COSAG01_NODE_46201_length_402_cov_0.768977_1_plen_57_part_10